MSIEDSISIEHIQQDGLDILEVLKSDAYIGKVSLSYSWKPCVVIYNLIVQLDESVLNNLHDSVYHHDAHQLQGICGVEHFTVKDRDIFWKLSKVFMNPSRFSFWPSCMCCLATWQLVEPIVAEQHIY